MEDKRITHIANAMRNNQDEYELSIHETAYWKRRESIEKKVYDHTESARLKEKSSKEKTLADTVPSGKKDCKVIPKTQEMTMQMRVEKGKTRDTARRKARAITKDSWLVQMPETIIERKDEDDENAMSFAEKYTEWRERYNIVDEDDVSGNVDKVVKKQLKRVRIAKRREKAIEEEEKGRCGGAMYY